MLGENRGCARLLSPCSQNLSLFRPALGAKLVHRPPHGLAPKVWDRSGQRT